MSAVVSVSADDGHHFSKTGISQISLVAGIGVDGDAHSGKTVKHRSRVAKDPSQPNLRQVHLIHQELLVELNGKGFAVEPGQLGENILTHDIELLNLPRNTHLQIGQNAVIEITGLRNPCYQLNDFIPGLMNAALDRDDTGNLIRKAGIMAVVKTGGTISAGDEIQVFLPSPPHQGLEPV